MGPVGVDFPAADDGRSIKYKGVEHERY